MTSRREILVLTGTCGVGKTTIARAWADKRAGAVVHADRIREWIRNAELRKASGYQEEVLARVSVTAAREFLALGLDVALDNVWTPSGIRILREEFREAGNLRFVRIRCEPSENHRRDQGRSRSDIMGQRVDELERELAAMNWPTYVTRIDTTGKSVAETVQMIEQLAAI
jgi:predicted kinase